MAEGYTGVSMLLKLGASDGTGTTPYVTIGGFRSTDCSLNNAKIDVTNKDNMPWQTLIAGGVQNFSISGDGVVNSNAVAKKIRELAFSGAIVNFQLAFGNGDTIAGAFKISKFDRKGPHDKEETFSISLESSGTVTQTQA
ncbi:phage tail tube protein [Caudoviricetes sp.]|nr:phage tail tube protein [Caudoviricetes sp.]